MIYSSVEAQQIWQHPDLTGYSVPFYLNTQLIIHFHVLCLAFLHLPMFHGQLWSSVCSERLKASCPVALFDSMSCILPPFSHYKLAY